MRETDEPPSRRDVLRKGVLGAGVALFGTAAPVGTSAAAPDGVPVVDNGGSPDETVTVDVRVVQANGDPIENAEVKLEDNGGAPDDRYGHTGPEGRIRFLEAVDPATCNHQAVDLPAFRESAYLGCNDGGEYLSHVFVVGRDGTPLVRNQGQVGQNVLAKVTVVDENGAPVADEPVELEDRGGTPDDRYHETGEDGSVLFLESTGPSPCNSQTVKLPDRDRSVDLGCNDGYAYVSATFTVSDAGDGADEAAVAMRPSSPDVPAGGTRTVDVVAGNVDSGVGSYELTLLVDDQSVLEVTDVTGVAGDVEEFDLADDGGTATVRSFGDETGSGTVTLFRLAVEGQSQGSTSVTMDGTLSDAAGDAYATSFRETTFDVTDELPGVDVDGNGTPSANLDDDPAHEDVDGDGDMDVLDVQKFFANRDSEVVTDNPTLFDYNGDGDVNVLDVQAMFRELSE